MTDIALGTAMIIEPAPFLLASHASRVLSIDEKGAAFIRRSLHQVENFKRANKELRELLTEVVERMHVLETESRKIKLSHDAIERTLQGRKKRVQDLEDEKKTTAVRIRVLTERFYTVHQALDKANERIALLTSTFDTEVAKARQAVADEVSEQRTGGHCICCGAGK